MPKDPRKNRKRYISLPAVGIRVSLGEYLKGIRRAKANPDQVFKHGLTDWCPCTGRQILRQFLEGVNDRINQQVPYMRRGIGKYAKPR